MNNFKKFVAVLLGVVMACVFATSAFAADFSKADTAAKRAKAEIKSFAASYGITTIDNTVNSLTADQLQTIYDHMDVPEGYRRFRQCHHQGHHGRCRRHSRPPTTLWPPMNSLLSAAGVSISATRRIDTSDSSKFVVTADVTANNAKDIVSVVAQASSTTTTDNNTNASDCCQQRRQEQCCCFQRQDRFFRCEPHHRFFQRCHQGHRR